MWEYLGIYTYVSMSFGCSVVLRGVSEGSFHAGSSLAGNKPTDLAQHQKARLFSPDAFKTSKYQNLPMYHFQKWLGFAIFCEFNTCHKEITIDSLIGSPCIACQATSALVAETKLLVYNVNCQ